MSRVKDGDPVGQEECADCNDYVPSVARRRGKRGWVVIALPHKHDGKPCPGSDQPVVVNW